MNTEIPHVFTLDPTTEIRARIHTLPRERILLIEEVTETPLAWKDVRTASEKIVGGISPQLIEDLGFEGLNWNLLTPKHARDALFLGRSDNNKSQGYQSADGIIEINADARHKNNDIFKGQTVTPHTIRLSGTTLDSAGIVRALALSFELNSEDHPLKQACVSVSQGELPPIMEYRVHEDIFRQYRQIQDYVPTLIKAGFYDTAGIITRHMVNETDEHTTAVKLSRLNTGDFSSGFFDDYNYYPNPGFKVSNGPDSATISFDIRHASLGTHSYQHPYRNGLIPWEVTVPKTLGGSER